METPAADPSSTDPAGAGEETYDRFTERVWTDSNGKQVTGSFFSLFREDAQIKVTGSGVVRVPLANLSAADIDWIREYLRRNNQLQRLPVAYRLSPDDPAAMDDPAVVPQAGLRDMRVWTDRKGNRIQARFFSVSGKDLKLTNRGFKTVPLAQLSRDDLIWLQDALKEEGRLYELPLAFRDPPDESLSELELVRLRRTGYVRKWTLYNGKSFVATYVRMSEGEAQLNDGSQQRGFPWFDLSNEDQEYIRGRLEREIEGRFFPEQADIVLATDEIDNGWRLWTDLDERQVKGRYVKRDHGLSVAVIETPGGGTGLHLRLPEHRRPGVHRGRDQTSDRSSESPAAGTGRCRTSGNGKPPEQSADQSVCIVRGHGRELNTHLSGAQLSGDPVGLQLYELWCGIHRRRWRQVRRSLSEVQPPGRIAGRGGGGVERCDDSAAGRSQLGLQPGASGRRDGRQGLSGGLRNCRDRVHHPEGVRTLAWRDCISRLAPLNRAWATATVM